MGEADALSASIAKQLTDAMGGQTAWEGLPYLRCDFVVVSEGQTVEVGTIVARIETEAGAKRLVLFHHCPTHSGHASHVDDPPVTPMDPMDIPPRRGGDGPEPITQPSTPRREEWQLSLHAYVGS